MRTDDSFRFACVGWRSKNLIRCTRVAAWLFGATFALAELSVANAQSCTTEAVDVDNSGAMGIGDGFQAIPSTDGRFIAFVCTTALVPQDTDTWSDAYVRDRLLGQTELVSVSSVGIKANAGSDGLGGISADGRYVCFSSYATNLVPGDTNNAVDVFVHDRVTGTTSRVSVGDIGQQGNSDSVAYGTAISADGRFVAYTSSASNLWPNDTNGAADIFLYDRNNGTSRCVSLDSNGAPALGGCSGPQISADGRFVVFYTASLTIGTCGTPTGDGVVYDAVLGTYECLALTPGGQKANSGVVSGGISADGRFVTFSSSASNLVSGDTNNFEDIFVRDRLLGITSLISVASSGAQGDGTSDAPVISANGRFVAFESSAANLAPGDGSHGWDIFIRDRQNHTTTLVSQNTSGVHGNNISLTPAISADGTVVAFESDASNLVPNDVNGFNTDVFVRACPMTGPFEYCVAKTNSFGCLPAISWTGTPSASSGQAFDIAASGVINHKPGLLLYSVTGEALIPFDGGFLCLAAPLKRTQAQISSGAPPPILDCSGAYHYDFNALIQSGKNPALVTGQPVWTQYWSRDLGFAAPNNVGLTDALLFTIGP